MNVQFNRNEPDSEDGWMDAGGGVRCVPALKASRVVETTKTFLAFSKELMDPFQFQFVHG